MMIYDNNAVLDALTMDIFHKLMVQDTINPPGNEKRGAQCLRDIFETEDIPCEIQDMGNNRANFIAVLGSGTPMLEFSGHLDTVPTVGEWRHPKIGATEEGGLIYGRGACDMKGGIAAMCAAAIWMHRQGLPKKGSLRLSFVADEEHTNLGMHTFLKSHKVADYTILGEPTDLHVAVAHRGVARYYVDLHGHACHAALRPSEETAMASAARAILAIDVLNRQLLEQEHGILPSPSIAVTQVQGYEKDNVIPGTVRLLTDYRILPGTSDDAARRTLILALNAAGIENYTLEKRFYMPGGEVDPDSAFVINCLSVAEKYNGRLETAQPFGASCEQCFLVDAGSCTVILGPGSLNQAHTVDEFVEKSQLTRAARIYLSIANRIL